MPRISTVRLIDRPIRWALVWVTGTLPACGGVAVRAIGTVHPADPGTEIRSSEGRSRALVLAGEAVALGWLEGELVELEGTLRRGAIEVQSFQVIEGVHGLPVWVGEVVSRPGGLALHDRRNGVLLRLDTDITAELAPWIGRTVLVEGFVEDALGLRVMYWAPLSSPPAP